MDPIIQQKADVLVALARRNLERDGRLAPALAALFTNGAGVVRALDFSNDLLKQAHLQAAYEMLYFPGVAAVMVMAEAWWVERATLDNPPVPSACKDRRECINVTLVTRSEKRGAIVPFTREGPRLVTSEPRWHNDPAIGALTDERPSCN